jgi:hypothetical protein
VERVVSVESNGDVEIMLGGSNQGPFSFGEKRRDATAVGLPFKGFHGPFRVHQADGDTRHRFMDLRIGDAAGQDLLLLRGSLGRRPTRRAKGDE